MPKLKAALKRRQELDKYIAKQKRLTQVQEEEIKNSKARASGVKKNKNQPKKVWIPFAHHPSRVLLVGEGDFSFSKAILEQNMVDSIVCTSLDSEQTVRTKYPKGPEVLDWLQTKALNEKPEDEKAENSDESEEEISDEDGLKPEKQHKVALSPVEIHYEIDGTKLTKYKPLKKYMHKMDMVVFNFPHLGNSVKDQDRNILQHQKLVLAFLESAKEMICETGYIMVSLFEGEPYISWDIKKLAKSCGLETLQSGTFEWSAYPGYHHCLTAKHGDTNKPQASRAARAYVFKIKEQKE